MRGSRAREIREKAYGEDATNLASRKYSLVENIIDGKAKRPSIVADIARRFYQKAKNNYTRGLS